MTIYERIHHLCEDRNTSVNALCTTLSISNGNQKTWKNDNINSDQLRNICNYLEVSADYLLGREDKKLSPVLTTEDKLQVFFDKLTQLSQAELQELDNYLAFLEYKRSL